MYKSNKEIEDKFKRYIDYDGDPEDDWLMTLCKSFILTQRKEDLKAEVEMVKVMEKRNEEGESDMEYLLRVSYNKALSDTIEAIKKLI